MQISSRSKTSERLFPRHAPPPSLPGFIRALLINFPAFLSKTADSELVFTDPGNIWVKEAGLLHYPKPEKLVFGKVLTLQLPYCATRRPLRKYREISLGCQKGKISLCRVACQVAFQQEYLTLLFVSIDCIIVYQLRVYSLFDLLLFLLLICFLFIFNEQSNSRCFRDNVLDLFNSSPVPLTCNDHLRNKTFCLMP